MIYWLPILAVRLTAKANFLIENSDNEIENKPKPTMTEEVETMKIQLAKLYSSVNLTATDNMKIIKQFAEIKEINKELKELKAEYENLIKTRNN